MSALRVTLAQQPLAWEDKQANLSHFEGLLSGEKGQTDLMVLPEMFTTGFTMNAPALAETMSGPTVAWMQRMAEETGAAIMGSFICSEAGVESTAYHNRLLWADGRSTRHYDKRHLFTFAGEHFHYSAGDALLTLEHKGWRIRPLICYDLRFPVWCRYTPESAYDLLILVANWPEARSAAWRSLLMARAHENQCYVIGVNRVGTDGRGIAYSGESMAISPKGDILCSFPAHQAGLQTVSLDLGELRDFREKFRVLDDADRFALG